MNRSTFSPKPLVTVIIACCLCFITSGCASSHSRHVDKSTAADAPAAPEFKLPPGWTEADMQACMIAGTPGEMHKHLAQGAGTWDGKNTMWMYPGADPVTADCVSTAGPIMGGRYLFSEMQGDMPGMGPYHGSGVAGYDNALGKFVSSWIDNQSTGIMNGTGELSADGKVLTWKFNFSCPITKKLAVMREIETITGPDTKTLVMYGPDPKTGKEFKMMSIELTRRPAEAKQGE